MSTTLVGGLTGEISARPLGSSTLTDRGQGVDFAIGGLGFKMAVSDQRPYERATAPFKKDQFDSAPTPGEQALTGWWMRSQMSFHKGAGLKYYEVLDGETILNRYASGAGVDVSTPGEVSVRPNMEQVSAVTKFMSYATCTGRHIIYSDGTTLHRIAATLDDFPSGYGASPQATISTSMTGGTIRSLASRPGSAYVAITKGSAAGVIEEMESTDSSSATLWTHHVVGEGWSDIFFTKGRLLALDTEGNMMFLSTAGGTSASGDVFASIPQAGGGDFRWHFAETPGVVIMGRSQRLYALAVDEGGAVPTVAPPAQIAELPADEFIRGINFYLGHLAIVTTKGVRFGVLDGTALTYGPRVVDFQAYMPIDPGVTKVAHEGSHFLAAGRSVDGVYGLYDFDLTNMVSELVPAHGVRFEYPTTPSFGTSDGVFVDEEGNTVYYLVGQNAYSNDAGNLLESATLLTGFHRYGTLEPKKFHSVKVRVAGSGGTIAVARVMADGSEVDLYTFDLAVTQGDEIALGLAVAQEFIGLKFTLSRSEEDPTVGPILLGYQLRALPSPKRQRLIRVPLELFDVERAGGARASGRTGDAWLRLEALEDMESSGGTFQFQDFRTGEAGECSIESIEHIGTTSTGRHDSGFGGIVHLTIRKL